MDVKIIERALRDYRRKKSVIETTLARIKSYKDAINNPEEHRGLFLGTSREPGMPTGKGYKPTSMVEHEVISDEKQVEILKQWIKDDSSRIYPLQIEKEQIDAAMGALTKQQRYIVECKYFEDMFWRDIEINFNDKFRGQNYITYEGLKKINKEAIDLLTSILEPYYTRFKILQN